MSKQYATVYYREGAYFIGNKSEDLPLIIIFQYASRKAVEKDLHCNDTKKYFSGIIVHFDNEANSSANIKQRLHNKRHARVAGSYGY